MQPPTQGSTAGFIVIGAGVRGGAGVMVGGWWYRQQLITIFVRHQHLVNNSPDEAYKNLALSASNEAIT